MDLSRGQRAKIQDVVGGVTKFDISPAIESRGLSLDYSVFGVDAAGKLAGDEYMCFYNQPSTPCGGVSFSQAGGAQTFTIDLNCLPPKIDRLVLTASIDGSGTMSLITSGNVNFKVNGSPASRFTFAGTDFTSERALILGEVYRKDCIWRFSATAQGFAGGLDALVKHYGGEVAEVPSAINSAQEVKPPQQKVNLGKVSLDKRGASQTVNLKKNDRIQRIHINLNWDQPASKGFFKSFGSGSVDLDLGCMYKLSDGSMGVIQPLGKSFGSETKSPYILLDKDDRSGVASDGENLYLCRPDLIELVVVFAMIYEGTANFSTVNGRLTIKDEVGSEILIPLNTPDPKLKFCAVAKIVRENDSVKIIKEEKYFPGHRECDNNYVFGFKWVAGSK